MRIAAGLTNQFELLASTFRKTYLESLVHRR
jgi:hypothetical protein